MADPTGNALFGVTELGATTSAPCMPSENILNRAFALYDQNSKLNCTRELISQAMPQELAEKTAMTLVTEA